MCNGNVQTKEELVIYKIKKSNANVSITLFKSKLMFLRKLIKENNSILERLN